MNPFGLPEQDPAVIRIREAAARDTLSHALLFTGGEPMPAARFAAAALECEGEGPRPCTTPPISSASRPAARCWRIFIPT